MSLMIEVATTVENDAGTFRLAVVADPYYPTNPREDSDTHLGVMVAYQRHYTLPEEGPLHGQIRTAVTARRFRVVARWLRVFHGATVVLPIYSGGGNELRLHAGNPRDDVDGSDYIGVIYDTPETRCMAWGDETPAEPKVVDNLRAEVAQYDTWANSEMTAWAVEHFTGGKEDDQDDSQLWAWDESCGGYFSTAEAREVGMPVLERIAGYALTAHMEALHEQALRENEEWQRPALTGARRALAVLRARQGLSILRANADLAGANLGHFGEAALGDLCDLVTELYHLAYLTGTHPDEIHRRAANRWHGEVIEDDEEQYAEAAEDRAAWQG